MKQLLLRKTLSGDWEEFQFAKKSRFFFVKNFTEGDIYVSFMSGDSENESFKIASGMGEEVSISFNERDDKKYYVKSIYVKGTGEVEIHALDGDYPSLNDVDEENHALEVDYGDNIEENTLELGSDNVEIQEHILNIN